jgi:hypothetical protein
MPSDIPSLAEARERAEIWAMRTLARFGVKNRFAFTALLIGGIMAIMIGSVLLIVSYVVVNAIVGSASGATSGPLGPIPLGCAGSAGVGCPGNGSVAGVLNASWNSSIGQIVQALGIIGIALVITGIAVIVYVLIGLGGTGADGKAGYR